MTTQASMALMPIVSVINNHVTALSTDVAKYCLVLEKVDS